MFEVFKQYAGEKIILSDSDLQWMESLSISRRIRKNQYLLQEGDVCHYNCFVTKGCLVSYRLSDKGDVHVLRFATENWWVSDRESFVNGTPSQLNIQASEDSEVILWSKENFEILMKGILGLSRFVEALFDRSLQANQKRVFAQISQSAEDRYHDFLKKFPDLINRVPLHMIASYLGVSRERLSRIRSLNAHKS